MMDYIDVLTLTRYSLQSIRNLTRIKGKVLITDQTSDDALAFWDLAREEDSARPGPDYEVAPPRQDADDVWRKKWIQRTYTAEEVAALLRQRVRERRDQAIYAGTTVNGMPIDTDEVTQGRLAGAALQAVIDNTYTVNWKAGGSFYTLDAIQIIAVAQAVRAHVQGCFDREAELLSLTDPETGEAREPTAEEIEFGWPA